MRSELEGAFFRPDHRHPRSAADLIRHGRPTARGATRLATLLLPVSSAAEPANMPRSPSLRAGADEGETMRRSS
jgi:hypothetical protein